MREGLPNNDKWNPLPNDQMDDGGRLKRIGEELYPELNSEEQEEALFNLGRYLEIVIEIFEENQPEPS